MDGFNEMILLFIRYNNSTRVLLLSALIWIKSSLLTQNNDLLFLERLQEYSAINKVFTSARDKDPEKLIDRLWKGGFLPDDIVSLADLAAEAERKFFRTLFSNPSQVLSGVGWGDRGGRCPRVQG